MTTRLLTCASQQLVLDRVSAGNACVSAISLSLLQIRKDLLPVCCHLMFSQHNLNLNSPKHLRYSLSYIIMIIRASATEG